MGPLGAQQAVVQGQQTAIQQGKQAQQLGTQSSGEQQSQQGSLKDSLFQSDVFERAGKQSVGGQKSTVGQQSAPIGAQK
jgi:hypothetical protein